MVLKTSVGWSLAAGQVGVISLDAAAWIQPSKGSIWGIRLILWNCSPFLTDQFQMLLKRNQLKRKKKKENTLISETLK